MIEGNTRLKRISYALIAFAFIVIWLDWALLIVNGKYQADKEDESCSTKVTLFGAGSLFGYVPLLSGVATLKRHEARRGLLLTTTISSCILAAYDVSEAMGLISDSCFTLRQIAVLFMLQAAFSAILICTSAFGWFSIHLSSRESSSGETNNSQEHNDCPPDYTSAVRDPESLRVRLEAGAYRVSSSVKDCFNQPMFTNKLIIPGTNLERITMTVSILTIIIVILQVVAEVLRVTASDHKCTAHNGTLQVWCNPDISISCVNGFGYYLTMPSFFILIFGVQIRVQRTGITIGGRYAMAIAVVSIISFISLTALAMVDFVSFIGILWFNRQVLSKSICEYIVYSAEITVVIQAVLSIGAAALALVGAYIIISCFIDKYNNTTSPARQMHQASANTNNRGSDPGLSNEAFTLDEQDGPVINDPKLPQYDTVRHVFVRTNSLPNLAAVGKYGGLPSLSSTRRTTSVTSLRNPSEPPGYTREIY